MGRATRLLPRIISSHVSATDLFLVPRHSAQRGGLGCEGPALWRGRWDPRPGISPLCFISSDVDTQPCTAVTEGRRKPPEEGIVGDMLLRCKQPNLHEINTCVLSSQAPGIGDWPSLCSYSWALTENWGVLMQSVIDYTDLIIDIYVIILCYYELI